VQKGHLDFFSYLIEPGYDLNDGMEENDPLEYRVEERNGYKGIRCGSMDRFIMLLTIAMEYAIDDGEMKIQDLPVLGGWDYVLNSDGSVFFYDHRYKADVQVIGHLTAEAVY
jgi:hypothetical protein